MKKVTKITTNKENIIFIGSVDGEEYYQDTNETGGWSFMGLRPATETELRGRARNRDIRDYGPIHDFLIRYIDEELFADDMEEQWLENHDSQAERPNECGDTLYLGFGSGQDANGYFKDNNIRSYSDYCNHFDEIGLTKGEFLKFKKEYIK